MAFEAEISAAATAHGIRPALLYALIEHESSFNPNAVGDNGAARGLGQMHAAACATVGANWGGMFDPVKALDASAAYLAFCIKHMGGELYGVMAYNQGPTVIGRAVAYLNAVEAVEKANGPVE